MQKIGYTELFSQPLVIFRICFGVLMCLSTIRFWLKGWIEDLYLKPVFFFSYYGFEWVRPLPLPAMYGLFFLVGLSALFVAVGLFYRLSILTFFLSFTYIELIDKTNYLNHYYLVSLLSFLLIFCPANRYYSVDNYFKINKKRDKISSIYIFVIKLQLSLVYFFAGIAKINSDWLLEALPMRIWLLPKSDMPCIGGLLSEPLTVYLFSWAGMFFDVSIGFLLWWRKTSLLAYVLVIIFHLITAFLFPQIGMFPFMMIFFNLIFIQLAESSCQLPVSSKQLKIKNKKQRTRNKEQEIRNNHYLFILYFIIQILFPLRYLPYPNHLFWSEEGFRFSWRVMLIEKTGTVFFTIKKPNSGQIIHIENGDFLTPLQEKMMSTQPDMILQFAHFLAQTYQYSPSEKVQVFAQSYVSLNGRGSRLFIDPSVDLVTEKEGLATKNWVLNYDQ
jgi:hypothetical protein